MELKQNELFCITEDDLIIGFINVEGRDLVDARPGRLPPDARVIGASDSMWVFMNMGLQEVLDICTLNQWTIEGCGG